MHKSVCKYAVMGRRGKILGNLKQNTNNNKMENASTSETKVGNLQLSNPGEKSDEQIFRQSLFCAGSGRTVYTMTV